MQTTNFAETKKFVAVITPQHRIRTFAKDDLVKVSNFGHTKQFFMFLKVKFNKIERLLALKDGETDILVLNYENYKLQHLSRIRCIRAEQQTLRSMALAPKNRILATLARSVKGNSI